MIVRELISLVGLDIKQGDFDKANAMFGGVSAAAHSLIGIFAAGAIVTGLTKIVHMASDAAETANVMGEVFGASLGGVNTWAEEAAGRLGRSSYELKAFAAQMGAVIGPVVKNEKMAADMSTTLAELAVDLSSFYNTTEEEAFRSLKSGLVGETEPLKKYGIVLQDATLKEYAHGRGITKKLEAMTVAEKSELRYGFIMNATKKAQGDAARTADGFANATRALRAVVVDLATDAGGELLPMINKIIGVAVKAGRAFKDWIKDTNAVAFSLRSLVFVMSLAAVAGAAYLVLKIGETGAAFYKFAHAIKWAGNAALIAQLKFLLIGAVVIAITALLFLLGESIYTWATGGKSAIEDFLKYLESPVSANDNWVVAWAKEGTQALEALGRALGTWATQKDSEGKTGFDKWLWPDWAAKTYEMLDGIGKAMGPFFVQVVPQWQKTLEDFLNGMVPWVSAKLKEWFTFDWTAIIEGWKSALAGFFAWVGQGIFGALSFLDKNPLIKSMGLGGMASKGIQAITGGALGPAPTPTMTTAATSSTVNSGGTVNMGAPQVTFNIQKLPEESALDFANRSAAAFNKYMQGLLADTRAATTPAVAR